MIDTLLPLQPSLSDHADFKLLASWQSVLMNNVSAHVYNYFHVVFSLKCTLNVFQCNCIMLRGQTCFEHFEYM